jgi:heme-degrading monooxygenase HmoA
VYARLVRYAIEPDRIDDALVAFRQAGRELAQLQGFQGGHVLVDPEGGTLMTLVLWEDRAALDRSEVRAASLRQAAVRTVEGEVQSVTSYEVPFELGVGSPSPPT